METFRSLWNIASVIFGAVTAWEWGAAFGRMAMPADWGRSSAELMGCVIVFAAVTGLGMLAGAPFWAAAEGNTHDFILWYAALPWRAAAFTIYMAPVVLIACVWQAAVKEVLKGMGMSFPIGSTALYAAVFAVYLLPVLIMATPSVSGPMSRAIKRNIARLVLPLRDIRRGGTVGHGGSSAFTSILDDWRLL